MQPPAAQARRCAAGNALAQHRHNGPSRICRQKEAGIPRQKHHGPEYQPQPAAHAPAVQGGAQHNGDQDQRDGKGAETNGAAHKLEHHNDGGKESASCEILRRFFI